MGTDADRTGALAALAGFEQITAARLRVLLAHHEPGEALAVAAGRARPHPAVEPMLTLELRAAWARSAQQRSVGDWARRCACSGIGAVTRGDPCYPEVLLADPQPPAVLFWRGDWSVTRRVGVSASSALATPRPRDATSPPYSGSPSPPTRSRWCPGWPRASMGRPTEGRCEAAQAGSSGSWPTAWTLRIHGRMPTYGRPLPTTACWCRSGHRGLSQRSSGFLSATASSPR